jgi:rhomboid-like protein
MGILYLLKNMPPAVKNLFFINLLFFVGTLAFKNAFSLDLMSMLSMKYFGSIEFNPIQVFTHMFMHGGFSHILFNMFGLIMFGSTLEKFVGTKKFLLLYLAAGLGSAFLEQAYWAYSVYEEFGLIIPEKSIQREVIRMSVEENYHTNLSVRMMSQMLGASGAIYGLLAAFGMFFPNSELMFLFIPFPIKAKYFIPGILLLDLFLGLSRYSWDNIAHFAHIGGALTGVLIVWIWKKDRSSFY